MIKYCLSLLSIATLILLSACNHEPTSGEADMLHGCFNDGCISNLNKAIDEVDEMLEMTYQKGNAAENYQAYVIQLANRKTENTPLYNPKLRLLIDLMRDNRVFFELFTMYDLSYDSHYAAAKQGLFSLYMLDPEKPFYKCWMKKLENPIIKAHLENYKNTESIDPMENLWYEVDNMSTMFDETDYQNPETRMYIAIFNFYHLAYMLNPAMMMKGVETDI